MFLRRLATCRIDRKWSAVSESWWGVVFLIWTTYMLQNYSQG